MTINKEALDSIILPPMQLDLEIKEEFKLKKKTKKGKV
jgi:hypothetical protein